MPDVHHQVEDCRDEPVFLDPNRPGIQGGLQAASPLMTGGMTLHGFEVCQQHPGVDQRRRGGVVAHEVQQIGSQVLAVLDRAVAGLGYFLHRRLIRLLLQELKTGGHGSQRIAQIIG